MILKLNVIFSIIHSLARSQTMQSPVSILYTMLLWSPVSTQMDAADSTKSDTDVSGLSLSDIYLNSLF